MPGGPDCRAESRWASESGERRPSGGLRAALHAMAGDERSSLGAPLEVQLRKDRADVVLDRLVRQEYVGRDLFVCLPLRDQQQDLLLLLGQLRHLVRVSAGGDAANPVQHFLRHRRVQQRLAPADRLEGADEIPAADLLEQIAGGSGDDRGEDRFLVRVAGEDDDPGPRELGADLAAGLDPGAVRQTYVHHDDVRLELASHLHGFGGCAGLGHDLEVLASLEKRHQALANDLVIVYHEQPQRACFGLVGHSSPRSVASPPGRSRRVTSTMIRVPRPGWLSTSRVPPMDATRARMLTRPWWPALRGISASKPTPLSLTTILTWPRRDSTSTVPRVPLEWRAMLLRASLAMESSWPVTSGGRSRSSTAEVSRSMSTMLLTRNSSASAASPPTNPACSSSSGRRPKMKLRMSRIDWSSESMARSTRAFATSGSSSISSGTSSSERPTA